MKEKDLIIQKITGLSKEQLFLNGNIEDKYKLEIEKAFIRLNAGEPIEYILEEAEFYGINFYIDSRVLIPRNDTEVMVDKALNSLSLTQENKITLIDVGTGSSCIPISILKNTDNIDRCYVVDISQDALDISKINIKKSKLENKIIQIHGDLLEEFLTSPEKEREHDYKLNKNIIITANLPYIKDEDYENMDKEVIKYEPKLALYGGKETGFELYQKLIKQCLELKKGHNIILFIEIGFDQKEVAENFLQKLGLKYEIFKDNSVIDRCIKIYI